LEQRLHDPKKASAYDFGIQEYGDELVEFWEPDMFSIDAAAHFITSPEHCMKAETG
jgi:hypothetical protein